VEIGKPRRIITVEPEAEPATQPAPVEPVEEPVPVGPPEER
jgi:hypothetical protein